MIRWNASLSIGVPEIDAQHQAIIALINDLEAMLDHSSGALFLDALNFLRRYSHQHFMLEEELMRMTAYPGLQAHESRHEQFVNHVVFFELEREFNAMSRQLHEDLLAFLTQWFIRHIAKEDMAFGAYLRLHTETPR